MIMARLCFLSFLFLLLRLNIERLKQAHFLEQGFDGFCPVQKLLCKILSIWTVAKLDALASSIPCVLQHLCHVFLSHFFGCFRGRFLNLFFAGFRLGFRSCHLMGLKGRYTPCGHEVSTLQMVLLFWARDIKTLV